MIAYFDIFTSVTLFVLTRF